MTKIRGYMVGKPGGVTFTMLAEKGMYAWIETIKKHKTYAYSFGLDENSDGSHTLHVQSMETGEFLLEKRIPVNTPTDEKPV